MDLACGPWTERCDPGDELRAVRVNRSCDLGIPPAIAGQLLSRYDVSLRLARALQVFLRSNPTIVHSGNHQYMPRQCLDVEQAMPNRYVDLIRQSGLSIYHALDPHAELFIPNNDLEQILNEKLVGERLNQPLRTRSKVVKTLVCQALGYQVPSSFKKTQPRFPGQNFDTYVQKADNLQIWNEEVSPSRRYVLVRLDGNDFVTRIRVVTGTMIAALDNTGTLTQKFQARSQHPVTSSKLISSQDTEVVANLLQHPPRFPGLMPIAEVFNKLQSLVGTTVGNPGLDQERNRGGALHRAVSKCLAVPVNSDSGQFPDVIDQLLEVKLQTSPTIDLGLVSPDGTGAVSGMPEIRHCDVRYSVFYGTVVGDLVHLDHVVVSSGKDFFNFFQRFGGKILNKKLQIPLPSHFFD